MMRAGWWLVVTAALVWPLVAGAATTTRVSLGPDGVQANGPSAVTDLSPDGRFLLFSSLASNIVADDANAASDVFLRDLETGVTELISAGPAGHPGQGDSFGRRVSADGRHVCFTSFAANLVRDDTNEASDVFLRDRIAGTTIRVSVDAAGRQANHGSSDCDLSRLGYAVVFQSVATNLVPWDTNGQPDIFLRDWRAGHTHRMSVGAGGRQATLASMGSAISGDGRLVAFSSASAKLVPGDNNGSSDVFVRDRIAGTTGIISRSATGRLGDRASYAPSFSGDSRHVAFHSAATNLVPADTNG